MSVTPKIPLLLVVSAIGMLALPAPAQNDDLLVVEKRKDLAARNKMLGHLRKFTVTVNFDDATVQDVVSFLHSATNKTVNIVISQKTTKAADMPRVSLKLKSIKIPNLLSTIENQTDLRFTFSSGMIFLRPKAEVKAFTYLQMYDVRAAVMEVAEFIPPKIGLRPPDAEGGFLGGESEERKPINGYDIDRLIDLVKSNAVPDSWDTEGVTIDGTNGLLMVRQTVKGHQQTRELLEKLGAIPKKRVIVRRVARPKKRASRKAPRKAPRKAARK